MRDRERDWSRDGKRERDTESKTGSRLGAVSAEPDAGLKLRNRKTVT